jgi:putative heme-binding domain-containing protein
MDAAAGDASAPESLRLACLPLLAQRKWEDAQPTLRALLSPGQPPALQSAALALLKRFSIEKTSPMIYELLPTAGPAVRRELVAQLAAGAKSALDLFKRMERGEIFPALVDIETRWRWQRGKGELRDLAVKLFGQPSEDRAGVIASYMDCTKMKGDAQRGQAVFSTLCITCHKHGALGVEVGPPLSDVRVKPPEALLSDILDPNRMFEARWSAYQIDAKDGRMFVGLISSENAESVTITMMGGVKETVPRSAIKEMKSLDRSLMPPGLEGAITKEQMADLLAFLRGV